jgi:hypothetical protein
MWPRTSVERTLLSLPFRSAQEHSPLCLQKFLVPEFNNLKQEWKFVISELFSFKLLKPTGHVMHQQFNIQQLYVLPTLYLCVLYLSENK